MLLIRPCRPDDFDAIHAIINDAAQALRHVESLAAKPILIGTWVAAEWAIRFYEKHGYRQITPAEKDALLARYWRILARQVETSVVLASALYRWRRRSA